MNKVSSKYLPAALIGLAALTINTSSYADTLSSLYGDKDCFGTNAACIEDGSTWAPSSWGALTTDLSDPVWTDRVYSSGETASWTHSFTAGTYTDASLTFRTAGIADIHGPYDVFADGMLIGSMPLDGYGHILPETFTFGLTAAMLLDGIVNVSFSTISGDWWAMDYAEITAQSGVSAVPIPAAAFLFGPALLGFMGFRRKLKSTEA